MLPEDEKLLTPLQVADWLNVKPQTLAQWRVSIRNGKPRGDLPFVKIGNLIRYRRSDVEKWLDTKLVEQEKRRDAKLDKWVEDMARGTDA